MGQFIMEGNGVYGANEVEIDRERERARADRCVIMSGTLMLF